MASSDILNGSGLSWWGSSPKSRSSWGIFLEGESCNNRSEWRGYWNSHRWFYTGYRAKTRLLGGIFWKG